MSDLISRQALIDHLESMGRVTDNRGRYIDMPMLYEILDLVEDQDTAYDVDKVVEQLEKCISDSLDKFDFGISRATYEKALCIVKRGGINEV